MTTEQKRAVKRMILDFTEREGDVIPIEEIKRLAKAEGIEEEDSLKAIEEMIQAGQVNKLDDKTIRVTE